MTGISEALTRRELIDPALKQAGWDVDNPDQVGIEIPADGFDPAAWKQLHKRLKETDLGWLRTNFSGIVRKSWRFQKQQKEAIRQSDHLFDTLLHRAFNDTLQM